MAGRHHDQLLDSKTSSDETTSSEQNDETGFVVAARSYECVFCKRGFTTAQALGGHMNIHRKDRATNKITINTAPYNNLHNDHPTFVSPLPNTKKFGEEETTYLSSFLPPFFAKKPSEGIPVNYQTPDFPVVSGVTRVPDSDDDDGYGYGYDDDDDLHECLTLGIGIHTSSKDEIITQRGHNRVDEGEEKMIEEDEEVDLELRLGYDKY